MNGQKYLYRAHPSFRSNAGLKCDLWYDWALFNCTEGELPGQINCFLEIKEEEFVEDSEYLVPDQPTAGFWCVTREFVAKPTPVTGSRFVTEGTLGKDYCLRDCDTIVDDIAVVPNIKGRDRDGDGFTTDKDFFVVGNRNQWLGSFWKRIQEIKNSMGKKRKRQDDGEE